MRLEFVRVLCNFRDKGRSRLCCDFLVIPFLVSLMLMFAYVCRDEPNKQRTSFVYFSTLYAFWCGLFGSCQAFNGEASSGEWSYWVLGQRRPLFPHLLSHFIIGLIAALTQVAVCAMFMGLFSVIGISEASLIRTIADMLASGGDYGLAGYWCLRNCGTASAYYWAVMKYLFMGLFAASLSGTCLGLLVSSVFKNPQASLSTSVCLIVACTVLSQTSIKGEGGGKARDFAPVSLVLRQHSQCARHGMKFRRYNSFSSWTNGGIVELASWLLPQRFFFNIGRLPFFKLEGGGRTDNWLEKEKLFKHQSYYQAPENLSEDDRRNIADEIPGCLCPVCVGLVEISRSSVTNDFNELDYEYYVISRRSGETIQFDNHWLHAALSTVGHWKELLDGRDLAYDEERKVDQEATQKLIDKMFSEDVGMIRVYRGFFQEMAFGEMAVIFFQSVFMILVSFICLKKKEVFNELR